MGFFDEFTDTSTGDWVGKDEKADLIENGTVFVITGITREDSQYGERYVATCVIGEKDRLISFPFGTVASRDRMLAALEKFLDDPAQEPPGVFLEKVGRSIVIRPEGA